jgi:hypothetical protein
MSCTEPLSGTSHHSNFAHHLEHHDDVDDLEHFDPGGLEDDDAAREHDVAAILQALRVHQQNPKVLNFDFFFTFLLSVTYICKKVEKVTISVAITFFLLIILSHLK